MKNRLVKNLSKATVAVALLAGAGAVANPGTSLTVHAAKKAAAKTNKKAAAKTSTTKTTKKAAKSTKEAAKTSATEN